ncbi:hypothetical protein MNBD_GAMMA01-582 [hydrothermal vent metagenome]|uniref:DUF4124 domain-containing protein n=1 Tax=hydrothermal vent metagenome TaxID=652676 RepID=A0A3B0W6C9_9ZZZZ
MVGICFHFSDFSNLEKYMNKFLILIITMMLVLISSDASAAKKLYKWVDEHGNITYSDKVPPSQIKKKHEELNKHGVVLEKVANAKTKEEIKAARAERLRQIEAEKQAEELERQRQTIIKTYTSESEITRLKNERMAALQRNIELANQSLEFQKTSREQLLAIAADNERNGKEISPALKSRIEIVENKIKYQIQFIEIKQIEIVKVKTKFANDIKIYREAMQAAKGS